MFIENCIKFCHSAAAESPNIINVHDTRKDGVMRNLNHYIVQTIVKIRLALYQQVVNNNGMEPIIVQLFIVQQYSPCTHA